MKKTFNAITASIALLSLAALFAGGYAGAPVSRADAANVSTSFNWAGYTATGGTYTSVGASWIVPESSAASGTLSVDATWVGIGGVTSKDLIQAGTQAVFQNGAATYEAWYELLPADSVQVPLTVHPGDAMTVDVTRRSAGEWQISFVDATTGQNYEAPVAYQSSLSSAEWIEEMPSGQRGFVPLDDFGTVAFTDAFAVENGERVTIEGSGAQSMTMVNDSQTGSRERFSARRPTGASFTISRTDASSANSTPPPRRGGAGAGRGPAWV